MQQVPETTIPFQCLAAAHFLGKAELFEERQRGQVVLRDERGQAVQVEFDKGVTQEQAQGRAAVALAPVFGSADAQADEPAGIRP